MMFFASTAEWAGQQLRNAFSVDQLPVYLLRDRDRIYGQDFREQGRQSGPPCRNNWGSTRTMPEISVAAESQEATRILLPC